MFYSLDTDRIKRYVPKRTGAPLCLHRPSTPTPTRTVAIPELQHPVLPIHNWKMEVIGEIKLRRDIFNVPIRRDILQRVVKWQLAAKRKGLACAKTRAEVRGGGALTIPFR